MFWMVLRGIGIIIAFAFDMADTIKEKREEKLLESKKYTKWK